MHIVIVGLNHRSAPIHLREKFSIAAGEPLTQALLQLKQYKDVQECVIMSTCNRTEIYAVVDPSYQVATSVFDFMESWFGMSKLQFNQHLYVYEHEEAIAHLFRVTCGLDSMVIGETQILGQVRDAFLVAQRAKTTNTLFNRLFQQAITMAKRVHTETGIAENATSVSYAAVELGKQILGNLEGKTAMIIGAGKMSELAAKHLHASGMKKIIVINRTKHTAEQVARLVHGQAGLMSERSKWLSQIDMVISSTGARSYVLEKREVQQTMQWRKREAPLVMIDIAVPRDIDPAISSLDHVYLYDIDDLEGIVDRNVKQRHHEAKKIESMIEQEISSYNQWRRTIGVGPVIRALQEKSASVHQDVMEDLLRKLPDLGEREVKVIHKLTRSIVNQMLQDPILRIKEMVGEHGDEALTQFVQFFALEEQVNEFMPSAMSPIVKIKEGMS